MKTIRGTAVTEMKKKMPHDSHCQLKRPHGLEHKTLNYKKHGPKIYIKKFAWKKQYLNNDGFQEYVGLH